VNTAELLTIPASAFPDQEILRWEGRGISYADLVGEVERVAGALRDLGAQPTDRVAILDTNTPSAVALLFACGLVEATFVPLNYRARSEEVAHLLTVAQPRVLFVGARYRETAESAVATAGIHGCQLVSLEAPWPGATRLRSDVTPADPHLAALLFTSGTTSRPKAVMLDHQDLTSYVFNNFEMASGEDTGTVAVCAPFYHIAGITSVLSAVFSGRRLALMQQFDAAEWLHLVERERVTHAFLVPTMLKRVLDAPELSTTNLSSLRVLTYGAAPMPLQVIRRAIETLPAHVSFSNSFGQTESTATVTLLGPEDHRLDGAPEEIEARIRRLASVGRPLPGIEVRILDESDKQLPVGQVGEIAIRSERLMRGYYGDEQATASTIRDGWLLTRDLGWLDDAGYLFLAGRRSDMIIRGGENIAPEEVEVVLASHPAVDEAAVFGIPDVEWGEVVATAIVLREGESVREENLIEYCRQRLSSFKKPDHVVFVRELPHNSMGKLLRRELRSEYARLGRHDDVRQFGDQTTT
jgi:acyl-CoA synthetase (AMP-forming)/AMP-acid ligase II